MTDTNASPARWPNWLLRISIVALIALPVMALGSRFGLWPFGSAFTGSAVAIGLEAVILLVAIIGIIVMLMKNRPAERQTLILTSLIALLPIIYAGYQVLQAFSVPPIHNISTDVVNPPEFVMVPQLRGDGSNPLEYNKAELVEAQQEAYPDVKTLKSSLSMQDAFSHARTTVGKMGWEMVSDNEATGIIEATETTFWYGFKDDIVIRIQASDSGSLVDLRSVSRVGRSDVGANAARIKKFLNAFQQNN
ncbi:MAG: DUF1499 domain-containing protein [Pseudomonadota bacterium]